MKLPINLLLYVAIAALLGASGLQFWEALQERSRTFDQKQNRAGYERRVQAGREDAGKVSVGPDYTEGFWSALHVANFTGKEPPEVLEAQAREQAAQEEQQQTPEIALDDIFAITCMVFDGEESLVVIGYKQSANVEPPAEVLDQMGMAIPGAGMDAVPGRTNGPSGPRPGALPTFGDGLQ